jgi:hypothetical protein
MYAPEFKFMPPPTYTEVDPCILNNNVQWAYGRKEAAVLNLLLSASLLDSLMFSEIQQSLQWGMGPPQPLTPQCRWWSEGSPQAWTSTDSSSAGANGVI